MVVFYSTQCSSILDWMHQCFTCAELHDIKRQALLASICLHNGGQEGLGVEKPRKPN